LNLSLEILDTAGQDDYQGMLDMWINFADGILLVFAVNDRESFDALERKRDRIIKTKTGKPCSIVIVGNKCDLQNERQVDETTAKNLADSWNAGYIETSATVNLY
jgi:small GTP-binding protein